MNQQSASVKIATKPSVFIDGEAGTTGLGIAEQLRAHGGVELRQHRGRQAQGRGRQARLMAGVDLVVLCLPDDAAKETVALADTLPGGGPRILDASTAHRVARGLGLRLPGDDAGAGGAIAKARRVANPGCYPTGGIALLRPLVDAGLIAGRLSGHRQRGVGLFGRRQVDDRGL